MATATIRLEHPVDLRRTVFPLVRGDGDPTARVEGRTVTRAVRTPDGPATVRLTQTATTRIDADAVGPGTEHALAVTAPGLAGAFDDPGAFTAIEPIHPVIAAAWRDHCNVLLPRADPFPVLIAAILEQKVTGIEARKAWRQIVRRTSDAAPGDMGLFLPPDPERLAAIPGWELTRLGVTGQRAETLREAARHPKKVAALTDASWLAKFGDPDAISVGDAHLPHIVCFALAGEPRGTDERMLELLEPYRGQRGRVEVLLEASGITPPAFGPKVEPRSFV